jgi:thiamine monophosphate kinase
LSADVDHLADASGVGFRLDEVPVAVCATLEDALGGGEDYELVAALPDTASALAELARAGLGPPLVIGVCTADPARRTLRGEPLAPAGWEHPWASSRRQRR